MSLVPHGKFTEWNVEGVVLFSHEGQAEKDPKMRTARSTTHLRVYAESAAEAEQEFAKAFVDDVRVTKLEKIR